MDKSGGVEEEEGLGGGGGEAGKEEGEGVMRKLANLNQHHGAALAPRIAAILHIPPDVSSSGEGDNTPPDTATWTTTYFRVHEEGEGGGGACDDDDDGGGRVVTGAQEGVSRAPARATVLNWDWWRKRAFLSEEDELRAREAARRVSAGSLDDGSGGGGKRRKEQEWIDALYAEFTNVIPHLKRAAYLLHACHQQENGGVLVSRAILPHLRWLRPSDRGWEEELWRERERSAWVACTMLVTYLEKALGDLLSWSTGGRQRVPCRINDLLVESALERLLGPDPIYVVRAFLGPPSGINLRNLLWHGFLDHSEFHPAYLDFMMVLASSLGVLLGKARREAFCAWEEALHCNDQQSVSTSQKSRQSRRNQRGKSEVRDNLRRLDALAERFEPAFEEWAPNVVLNDNSFKDAHALFSRSHFILPSRLPTWIEVLADWMGVSPTYPQSEHYLRNDYRGLLIALPQLEHSLRRVFVAVNDFAEERLLTAEVAVYYTTLEIMIAERHDPEACAEGDNYITADTSAPLNLLPIELGEQVMHLLRDLNRWITGPRIRSKISHGLIDRNKLHPAFLDLLMVAIVAICARYDPSPTLQGDFVSRCATLMKSYRPYFHPVSLMQRRASGCYKMWLHFHANIVVPDEAIPLPPAADLTSNEDDASVPVDEARRHLQRLQSLVKEIINQLKVSYSISPLFDTTNVQGKTSANDSEERASDPGFVALQHLHTRVFCSKHEESVVTVLTDVINAICEFLGEIEAKYKAVQALVRERKAYHHQRRNFAKLRLSLPFFGLVAQLIMLLVEETARAQDIMANSRSSLPHSTSVPSSIEGEPSQDKKEEAKREKQAIEHSPTFLLARSLHDIVGRQLACARDGEWERAKEIMGCWLGDDTRSYRLLSHRDRDKFWSAFPTLHSSLRS